MNREQERAMFALKNRPAKFNNKFSKSINMYHGGTQFGSQRIPADKEHDFQRVVRHPYSNSKGDIFALNKPLLTKEQIKNKKYEERDFNKHLDKQGSGAVRKLGIPSTHSSMTLSRHSQESADNYHQDYPVSIYSGTNNFQAFHTKDGLVNFLKENNLKITGKKNGLGHEITGKITYQSMSGNAKTFEEWGNKHGFKSIRTMSNGNTTEGFIDSKKGHTIVYTLNPNMPMKIFPHRNE